jgi:large subunit ribosomal protein L4
METKLLNLNGEEIGKIKLSENIFNQEVKMPLIWENVTNLLRNRRLGLAKTKNRAEVRGGGKKPWRQKGTGMARHGSIRSPIWRKGGVVFGPKPRDYSTRLPKRKKTQALISTLSAKARDNRVLVIDQLPLETPKTKTLVEILKKINLAGDKTLLGIEEMNQNLKLAGQNIPGLELKRVDDINCYDVLAANYVLFTKKGLEKLEQRCTTKKSS